MAGKDTHGTAELSGVTREPTEAELLGISLRVPQAPRRRTAPKHASEMQRHHQDPPELMKLPSDPTEIQALPVPERSSLSPKNASEMPSSAPLQDTCILVRIHTVVVTVTVFRAPHVCICCLFAFVPKKKPHFICHGFCFICIDAVKHVPLQLAML
jgi:hypothetical protein